MSEHMFKLVNVSKAYGSHVILENINLEVRRGEILGIIGPSGSGKTTLLNTTIGFVKPDKGEVLFRLEHSKKHSTSVEFQSVFKKFGTAKNLYGFASQVPSSYPNLSVVENLRYFASLYSLPKNTAKENINTLLHFLDLEDARKVKAKKLSGGMERRLDIACALIHDPDVLFLDEPTADLDPFLTSSLLDLIKKINKKGTTIVIASHNLNEMEHLCHRIAIVKDKRLFDVATPEELKHKYASHNEIHFESYPADYNRIINELKPEHGVLCEKKGSELVITTRNTHVTLHKIFHAVETMKEDIVDLKVTSPTLLDLFMQISEKDAAKSLEGENIDLHSRPGHSHENHEQAHEAPKDEIVQQENKSAAKPEKEKKGFFRRKKSRQADKR